MQTTQDVDLGQMAKRVSAARTRMGLSQTALAAAAGVSQPTVSRIESGQRAVSLMDADRMAVALGLPLDRLLYGSQVARRVLVSLRVDDNAPNVQQAVDAGIELLELDERLDRIVPDHRQQARPLHIELPTGPGSQSELGGRKLAASLREHLSLGTAPVLDLPTMLEELTGVDVATLPLPDDVSGMCLADMERGTTLVLANSSHAAERQRFTLAHELGHLLFGDGSHVDTVDDVVRPKERRAHEFARCLLVPPSGLRDMSSRLSSAGVTSPAERMSTLARHFGVSSKVINIQLQCEGLEPLTLLESTPLLASRYGWRAEYNAAQTAAATPKPPARLVRRVQHGYAMGKLGASVLARLLHRPEVEIVAELDDIGIRPTPPTRKRTDLESLRSHTRDTAGVVA